MTHYGFSNWNEEMRKEAEKILKHSGAVKAPPERFGSICLNRAYPIFLEKFGEHESTQYYVFKECALHLRGDEVALAAYRESRQIKPIEHKKPERVFSRDIVDKLHSPMKHRRVSHRSHVD